MSFFNGRGVYYSVCVLVVIEKVTGSVFGVYSFSRETDSENIHTVNNFNWKLVNLLQCRDF